MMMECARRAIGLPCNVATKLVKLIKNGEIIIVINGRDKLI